MTKKFDPVEALVEALRAPNGSYTPGIETARLDAAEAILTHVADHRGAVAAAVELLVDVATGKVIGPGAQGRVRACKILIAHGYGSPK